MDRIRGLPAERLRWRCDADELGFETTAELEDLPGVLGQARASSAIQFGIGIEDNGYNLYALGPPGQGKRTTVQRLLTPHAAARPIPDDWCYVHNFREPQRPRAMQLPAGRGRAFRGAMQELVEDLKTAIPAALESDEFRNRVQELQHEFEEQHDAAFAELAREAEQRNIRLIRTPGGFAMAPLHDGEVVGPEDFEKLDEHEKQEIQQHVAELQQKLESIMQELPQHRKATRDKIRQLTREVTGYAIGHLMSRIRESFRDVPEAAAYLEEVERDVLEHADRFHPQEPSAPSLLGLEGAPRDSLRHYQVNLLVDNLPVNDGQPQGAPVLFEDNPSYHNLLGRIEHQTQLGALVTDFTLIRAGSLHRANGGYLLIEALQLLLQPFAWQGLARALKARELKMEPLGQALSLISTVGLEPEPIPLNVRVILLGDRLLYYLLYQHDPDFARLFKVAADFDEAIPRSPESCRQYARLIAAQIREAKLRPFTRGAVARVLEHCARVAEDSERLSTHMQTVVDLLREAEYWAGGETEVVQEGHVQQAIDQQIYRASRLDERLREEVLRRTLLVDTSGQRVGQINGLSVLDLGNYRFGKPSRITATARLGRGQVVDIEREVELGGPLHSKGVLILSAFLAARYAQDRPLSLSASVVFEQSYGKVDGDSASLAELCALLSALAGLPIRQELAVTGSVNQLGQVQAIGGVNEKIEGFFEVCRQRGLTGGQGVLIPEANVKHLMLRQDIVQAVQDGQFHVYAVTTVDQAISLLTDVVAGEPDQELKFPAESVNGRVDARLRQLSRLREEYALESTRSQERRESGA